MGLSGLIQYKPHVPQASTLIQHGLSGLTHGPHIPWAYQVSHMGLISLGPLRSHTTWASYTMILSGLIQYRPHIPKASCLIQHWPHIPQVSQVSYNMGLIYHRSLKSHTTWAFQVSHKMGLSSLTQDGPLKSHTRWVSYTTWMASQVSYNMGLIYHGPLRSHSK